MYVAIYYTRSFAKGGRGGSGRVMIFEVTVEKKRDGTIQKHYGYILLEKYQIIRNETHAVAALTTMARVSLSTCLMRSPSLRKRRNTLRTSPLLFVICARHSPVSSRHARPKSFLPRIGMRLSDYKTDRKSGRVHNLFMSEWQQLNSCRTTKPTNRVGWVHNLFMSM